MKNLVAVALFLFVAQFAQAQFFKKHFYYEGEIGVITSFFVEDAEGKTHVFTLGGLSFRGGLGVHNEENSLFFGIHSGIEGNFRHDTGVLPVYVNSKVALDVLNDSKLILSFGYGKSFQIGTENYNGFLRKYTIGFGTVTDEKNMQTIFIEINNHGFDFPDGVSATSLNIGFTFTFL